jgi:hypothetical protein
MYDHAKANADKPEIGADLRAFATAGQDSEAVRILRDLLAADLDPKDLIERIWVRDIALLTIRSEELRRVQMAVHKVLLQNAADTERGNAGVAAPPRANALAAVAPAAASGPGWAFDLGGLDVDRLEWLVGMTYAQQLATFDMLARMEAEVRKDRERVILQFDRRRRSSVEAMLQAMSEAF